MKILDTVSVVALLLAGVIVWDWQTDIGDWGDSLNEVDSLNSVTSLNSVEDLEKRIQTSGPRDYRQVNHGWDCQ